MNSSAADPCAVEDGKIYPSIGQAGLLVLALLGLQVVGGVLLGVFAGFSGNESLGTSPVALGAVNLATFTLILLWGRIKSRQTFAKMLPLGAFPTGILLPLTVLIAGLSVLLSEADNALQYVFPVPEFVRGILDDLATGGFASLVTLVVIAPLTEEFLCRGLFLRGFLSRYSVSKAVLVSALLFAILHMNPYQFLPAFVLGVLMAWLFVRTGSLWPCIIAHALHNGLTWLAGMLPFEIPGYSAGIQPGEVHFQPLWFNLLGLLFVSVGFVGIARMATPKETTPERSPDQPLDEEND